VELSKIKEKFGELLKGDAPNVGELCAIWIAGVVSYAIVTRIEPFYLEGWYDFRFVILRKIPPQEHGWRVQMTHLQGDEFHIDGYPACIIALNMHQAISPTDDPYTIGPKTWKEMIDGKKKKPDDSGGGGCPDKCDTPCS
jgi:hypothetical protein